jgi:hypothetical protein
MSDDFLESRFRGGTNRQEAVDLPTLWTVQRLKDGLVTAVCPDHATATWWVETYGEDSVGYEKIGHKLTIRGVPSTITVRRMEVTRDGTPRVL